MRKFAEWVSFLVSALLILGLVGYLVYEMMQPQSQFVRFHFTPEVQKARQEGEFFVLPIRVTNLNDPSVNQLEFTVTTQNPQTKENPIEVTIDYLGGHSSEIVYILLKNDPRAARITVQPTQYRLQ